MYLEKLVETFGQRTKYASLVDDYRKHQFNPRDKELRRHLGRLNANSDMDRWKAYQWAQGVRDPKLLSNKAYRDAMRATAADRGMAGAAGYTGPMQAPGAPYSPSPEPAPAQRQFTGSFSPKGVEAPSASPAVPVPGFRGENAAAPEVGEPDIGAIDGGIGEAAAPMDRGGRMPSKGITSLRSGIAALRKGMSNMQGRLDQARSTAGQAAPAAPSSPARGGEPLLPMAQRMGETVAYSPNRD